MAARDYPALSILKQLHSIPVHILWMLAGKQAFNLLTLIFTARKYDSPKTALCLADLFMDVKDGTVSG